MKMKLFKLTVKAKVKGKCQGQGGWYNCNKLQMRHGVKLKYSHRFDSLSLKVRRAQTLIHDARTETH